MPAVKIAPGATTASSISFTATPEYADAAAYVCVEKGMLIPSAENILASGTALTFEQTASAAGFQKILNGNHTITVEVSDGKETVSTSATFTKAVHAASVTLAGP